MNVKEEFYNLVKNYGEDDWNELHLLLNERMMNEIAKRIE